jgi:streptogramin lyase
MRRSWARAVGVLLALLILGTMTIPAQEKESKYPHVNLATTYEFDPKWPEKPGELPWAAMSSIAVDGNDHIYLLTRTSAPVQVYDTKGKILRSWGKGMQTPHQLRIDPAGNIWITDAGTHVVEKYTADGTLLQTIGTKGKAGRDQSHFNKPTDIAFTSKGDMYVSDGYGNARVVHFDKDGKYLGEWGEAGQGPGQFSIPHSIAVDSEGRVYVADRNNVRIQVFDGQGKFLAQWRNLLVPWTFAMLKGDQLWVCGSSPMQWRKEDSSLGCPPKDQVFMRFDTTGKLQQLFTLPKGIDGLERPGEVNWVHAMAFDSHGNLYLGDIIGKRAQKFALRLPAK